MTVSGALLAILFVMVVMVVMVLLVLLGRPKSDMLLPENQHYKTSYPVGFNNFFFVAL